MAELEAEVLGFLSCKRTVAGTKEEEVGGGVERGGGAVSERDGKGVSPRLGDWGVCVLRCERM